MQRLQPFGSAALRASPGHKQPLTYRVPSATNLKQPSKRTPQDDGKNTFLLTSILELALSKGKPLLRDASNIRVMNTILILVAHASAKWTAGGMDALNLSCTVRLGDFDIQCPPIEAVALMFCQMRDFRF